MSDHWEAIRDLDEKENWIERTAVLSKEDHTQLVQCAKEILHDVVDNLPIGSKAQTQESELTEQFTDEDFQYSAAQFDVDYLERISSENSGEPSELARQSLYVKFDPLVGRDSPKADRIEPSTTGDLLMLNTPPPAGLKSCLASNKNGSNPNKKRVQIGTTDHEPLPESPLISVDTSQVPPSPKDPSAHTTTSLLDSSPKSLPSLETEQDCTDEGFPPNQIPATPPTEPLIKVLKYSEDDLTRMKEEAISETRQKARKEKEEEMDALRREIAALKREAKKLQQKDSTLKVTIASHQSVVAKLEAEMQQFRERVEAHEERENDVLEHHENCLKDMKFVKERSNAFLEDTNLLENIFEETHKSYLALKNTHKNLSQQTQKMEERKSQLKKWNEDTAALVQRLKEDNKALAQEIETKLEQSRKELAAKRSLEKAKQDQLHMQIESLQKSIQQLEQEKQQLSSMCEELMKAM